jgi:hypothetical protein
MATTTTNFGWDIPQSTDLVKDGATAIAALGQDIDTALVDLKGGTTGQVLAKASGTDLDFSWVAQDDSNAIQNAIVDAKGDLISATAADTPARLAVGANNTVLTADSSTATGLKWATPASGGKVLQVVTATYSTPVVSSVTSYVDTGLTASITPSSTSSKILVLAIQNGILTNSGNVGNGANIKLLRDSTQIMFAGFVGRTEDSSLSNKIGTTSLIILDSPATTSSVTYKTQLANNVAAANVQVQQGNDTSTITLLEIGA